MGADNRIVICIGPINIQQFRGHSFYAKATAVISKNRKICFAIQLTVQGFSLARKSAKTPIKTITYTTRRLHTAKLFFLNCRFTMSQ